MGEIDDKEAALLVKLIYIPELQSDWEKTNPNCTVKDLVLKLEVSIAKKRDSQVIAAEMNKKEFQEALDQIKGSEKLMSMTVENIENNNQTQFRAMTLKPPKSKQSDGNPIIVIRGTAGNYQWDDNVSATVSSLTPSQREAQKYVISSGYDHLTVVGHSKGGNMAASMAYLLPEGMVDKVYSLDGQGSSGLFLTQISLEKQQNAKKRVHNINEYRDIVSQLFTKTGDDKNTRYVDSGIDLEDTDYGFFSKMSIFHPHKPNYFSLDSASYVEGAYTPALVAQISKYLDVNGMQKHQAIALLMGASSVLHDTNTTDTNWDYRMWSAVYDAEIAYNRANRGRKSAILGKLSKLYGIDFSGFELVQEEYNGISI